jgi:hypothetical protein
VGEGVKSYTTLQKEGNDEASKPSGHSRIGFPTRKSHIAAAKRPTCSMSAISPLVRRSAFLHPVAPQGLR